MTVIAISRVTYFIQGELICVPLVVQATCLEFLWLRLKQLSTFIFNFDILSKSVTFLYWCFLNPIVTTS